VSVLSLFCILPFCISEKSLYRCTVDVGKLPNHVNLVSCCYLFIFSLNTIITFVPLVFVCVRDSRPFAQQIGIKALGFDLGNCFG
jgi:hypothetical protein